ncbi:GTP-binding protein AARP2 involved in 40S ribosome biogenesis, partial [Pseudoloma neurophilia]
MNFLQPHIMAKKKNISKKKNKKSKQIKPKDLEKNINKIKNMEDKYEEELDQLFDQDAKIQYECKERENPQENDEKFDNQRKRTERMSNYKPHVILDNNPLVTENKKYIDCAPSVISVIGTYDSSKEFIKKMTNEFYGREGQKIIDNHFCSLSKNVVQTNPSKNSSADKNLASQCLLPPITLRTSKLRRATFIQVTEQSFRKYDTCKISDLNILYLKEEDLINNCNEDMIFEQSNQNFKKNEINTADKIKLQNIIRFFLEYSNMVKSFGHNRLFLYTTVKNKNLLKYIQELIDIKIFYNYKKLVHFISCLKNKVTYLKCSNSYILIDQISKNLDDSITLSGYLRGRPMAKLSPENRNPDLFISGLSQNDNRFTVTNIEKLEDPTNIKNEKILERRKVFLHAPGLVNPDKIKKIEEIPEIKLTAFEDLSSEEEIEDKQKEILQTEDKMTVQDSTFSNTNHKRKMLENMDFESLRSLVYEKLEKNYKTPDNLITDDKLMKDNSLITNDNSKKDESLTTYDNFDENQFLPGDYLEIQIQTDDLCSISSDDILLAVKIFDDNEIALNTSSFNCDNNFHPNFIKSHDPVILSVGLFRFITFPIFYKIKEDGTKIYQKMNSERIAYWGYGGQSLPLMVHRQIQSKKTVKSFSGIVNSKKISSSENDQKIS